MKHKLVYREGAKPIRLAYSLRVAREGRLDSRLKRMNH